MAYCLIHEANREVTQHPNLGFHSRGSFLEAIGWLEMTSMRTSRSQRYASQLFLLSMKSRPDLDWALAEAHVSWSSQLRYISPPR